MAVFKRGEIWWYEFIFAGKRVQESAKTDLKTVAKEAEKNRRRELERTLAGLPSERRENRIKSVVEMVRPYLEAYSLTHREKSVLFARGRLANVTRLLGTTLLPDLTEEKIHGYIRIRLEEQVSGRTINMELGELSRAIGHKWSIMWPKVRKLEEQTDIGKALSDEEQERLLAAIDSQTSPNRSQSLATFVPLALLTAMRSGEITKLTWGQVDLERKVIRVGRAKTASGTGREIPINDELLAVLVRHAEWFTKRFGEARLEHYLFPYGKPTPIDPTRPVTDVTGAWDALRKRAGVTCRLHDLRHTALSRMAEAGVSESTMLALAGHMSRRMLERYSHIRMAAKRKAVEALTIAPKRGNSEEVPTKVPTVSRIAAIQ